MKKIILVGAAENYPLDYIRTKDSQVWTVARLCNKLDADVAFEMHSKPECSGVDYMDELLKFEGKIIGLYPDLYPDIEMHRYPRNMVNPYGMVTNTICYMLAYAKIKKPAIIELWRMPHKDANEIFSERSGVFYWIGQCEGAGIQVLDYSDLLEREKFYGRDL